MFMRRILMPSIALALAFSVLDSGPAAADLVAGGWLTPPPAPQAAPPPQPRPVAMPVAPVVRRREPPPQPRPQPRPAPQQMQAPVSNNGKVQF
jgi:hypothetical protein